jgi:selenocysteine-specific elongation factor
MHILGTAGHVDHGKSSLVQALTGTNPDRWLEEQLRGMTLDLGFAHLRFDDGVEAGIVDVPGHERFLHNMLAGAAGMELLLLVVAANEGPRPQTIEHLQILQYLNVRRTLVVLTKSDLVSSDELAFARELVAEASRGTIAADAPALAVSTVTGAGLDELRGAIHDALVALPPRQPEAPAYLPIDRVFALSGHGTIVTGTLMQGSIAIGDELALAPSGRRVRVRSLQVFGATRERVEGGSRVAVNVPSIERAEIVRGAVLASPQFQSLSAFDVRFRPLPNALGMLRRKTPVRAYIGAAEIFGTLAFEAIPASAAETNARLHLRRPTVAFPGAAFVVRRLSPKNLLGGGTIAGLDSRLERASGGGETDAGDSGVDENAPLAAALRDTGLEGATAARVGALANVREDVAQRSLDALVERGRVLRLAKPPAYLDAELAEAAFARITELLNENQTGKPWMYGTTSLALSRALEIAEPTLIRLLAVFAEDGRLAARGGYYATPGFVPALSPEQRDFFDRAFALDEQQPFLPVPFAELLKQVKSAKIEGLSQAFDTLLSSGVLVKVGDDVYRSEQISNARARLESSIRASGALTMAQFRDLVGTSRKYAVPLLEWFDASGVTIRNGDVRVLRERAKA